MGRGFWYPRRCQLLRRRWLVTPTPSTGLAGTYTFVERQSITFDGMQSVTRIGGGGAATNTPPSKVIVGTNLSDTNTVSNSGPSDAQNMSLTGMPPSGTVFVSATPVSGQNPDGFIYTFWADTLTGTSTGGVMAAGNTDQFILVVRVNSSDTNGSTIPALGLRAWADGLIVGSQTESSE